MSEAAYPPGPWRLRATLALSVFMVRRESLPEEIERACPPDARIVAPGGRVVVGVAAVRYHGGDLAYDEMLATVPTWVRSVPQIAHGSPLGGLRQPVDADRSQSAARRGRPRPRCSESAVRRAGARTRQAGLLPGSLSSPTVTVGPIRVSTDPACAGGRELWAIPKHVARFSGHLTDTDIEFGADGLGSLVGRIGRRLTPTRIPLPLTTAQRDLTDPSRGVLTRNQARAHMRALDASWSFDPAGDLAFLAGARPMMSMALADTDLRFGLCVRRTEPPPSTDEA